jgi:hypothetical protein
LISNKKYEISVQWAFHEKCRKITEEKVEKVEKATFRKLEKFIEVDEMVGLW